MLGEVATAKWIGTLLGHMLAPVVDHWWDRKENYVKKIIIPHTKPSADAFDNWVRDTTTAEGRGDAGRPALHPPD